MLNDFNIFFKLRSIDFSVCKMLSILRYKWFQDNLIAATWQSNQVLHRWIAINSLANDGGINKVSFVPIWNLYGRRLFVTNENSQFIWMEISHRERPFRLWWLLISFIIQWAKRIFETSIKITTTKYVAPNKDPTEHRVDSLTFHYTRFVYFLNFFVIFHFFFSIFVVFFINFFTAKNIRKMDHKYCHWFHNLVFLVAYIRELWLVLSTIVRQFSIPKHSCWKNFADYDQFWYWISKWNVYEQAMNAIKINYGINLDVRSFIDMCNLK